MLAVLGPILSVISAVPLYFYLTGARYSDNKVVKRLFKNFVWAYTKLQIASDYILDDTTENGEIVLQSVIEMEHYNFCEYKIRYNQHDYYITLINEKGKALHELKLEKLKQNLQNKIDNKNLIVHCSLVNEEDDIVLDVTEDFRKFKFYYDEEIGEEYTPYTKYFFEYLQNKYSELDLSNLSLMIYKNDEQFTELRHNIENLYTTTFRQLLN